ncbi:unnamed protein product [Jaminaea pallidilutea]
MSAANANTSHEALPSPSSTAANERVNSHEEKQQEASASGEPGEKKKGHWLENDVHVIPKNNLWIVFPGLMLCVFLAALDQTIVSTALPTIAADLGASAAEYSWVGTAYLLTASSMIPLYGRLSDLTGRKPLFFIAIAVFLFGSAMCSAAQNPIWLCACRGVQGIGGGGIVGLVNILVSDLVPLEKRGAFQGIFGSTWGLASVVGPVIGGGLASSGGLGWRWAFLINIPIGAVACTVLFFSLHLNPTPKRSVVQVAREFDFIGWLIIVAAIVIFLFGFSESETKGFNNAEVIALIVVGGCLFPVTIAWCFFSEKRFPHRRPIMPPRVFRTRTTTLILATVILHGFSFFTVTYELPIYFQAVKGSSAVLSGVYMLPYALIGSVVSALTGIVIVKIKAWRPVFWYSWTMSVIGYSLMTLIDGNSSFGVVEGTTTVAALGYGGLFQTPLLGMLSAMPQSEQAATTSTLALLRSMSGSMGISVAGAVFNTRARSLTQGIQGYDAPQNPSTDLRGLRDIQPPSVRQEVLVQYGQALRTVWIMLTPIVALGFLCSLPVKGYTMNRHNVAGKNKEEEKKDEQTQEGQPPQEEEVAATAAAGGAASGGDEEVQDHDEVREIREEDLSGSQSGSGVRASPAQSTTSPEGHIEPSRSNVAQ